MPRSRWSWFKAVLIAWGCGCLLMSSVARADTLETAPAPALFAAECAGCHVNGGNIVRRGKTLKLRALKRQGVDSVDAIANLITNGKGAMSAYGDRLSPEAIDLLAHYVWEQAQTNWR
jgi:cytochrome c6